MLNKTDKHQDYFEVQLNWQEGRKGILTASDVKDSIKVATPPECAGYVEPRTFIFKLAKQLFYDDVPGHCRKKKISTFSF
jgi:hypothetical protein